MVPMDSLSHISLDREGAELCTMGVSIAKTTSGVNTAWPTLC